MGRRDISLPAGYRLAFHEILDSTNAEALRLAAKGEAGPLWVWAMSQDAGRGRLGRPWESERGNLFASLLVRPGCNAQTATQLGFVAGLSLITSASRLSAGKADIPLCLKWPNDLLCDGMKAGGILLESNSHAESGICVVVGIGLNLKTHPERATYRATDLSAHGMGSEPAPALEKLAHAFDAWSKVWNNGEGFSDIRAAWLERALPVGSLIKVKLFGGTLQGRFSGLNETGALLMTLPDGSEKQVTAGDVFPV